MYSRRIVITGLGAITPIGNDVGEFWRALVNGRSGVAPLESFPTGDFRPHYAAEVKNFAPERAGVPRRKLKMMGRHAQLALAAALEAASDAGLSGSPSPLAPERLGVILGVGMLNADETELGRAFYVTRRFSNDRLHSSTDDSFDFAAFGKAGAPQLFPLWLLRHIPNLTCAHATIALDARGVSNTITTGCVSAANAVGEAARVIARGDADVMLAGGADARVSPLALLRYRDLGWLATRDNIDPTAISSPFDEDADGFVSGEGAGVLVLEAFDHALARGAHIYAELIGYSAANDAYNLLLPHPEGRGLARAISSCLKKSEVASADLDATFAPATSVPAFDRAGAIALKTVYHATSKLPVVTATRSLIGHTHAASAALDCIAAVKAINESQLPPILNLCRPIADFDFITPTTEAAARHTDITNVLVAAYGFGGHAAALTLRRCAW